MEKLWLQKWGKKNGVKKWRQQPMFKNGIQKGGSNKGGPKKGGQTMAIIMNCNVCPFIFTIQFYVFLM